MPVADIDIMILKLLSGSLKGEAGRLYYLEAARHPALGPWVDRKTSSNFFDRETELVWRMKGRLGLLASARLTMVDLGPGSAGAVRSRAAIVLAASNAVEYIAVDVAEDFLRDARRSIEDIFPAIKVSVLPANFFDRKFNIPNVTDCLIYMGGSTWSNYPVASYDVFPFHAYLEYLLHLKEIAGKGGRLLLGWHSAKSKEEALAPYQGAEATHYLETPLRVMIENGARGINLDQWIASPVWHEESQCVSHGLTAREACEITYAGVAFRYDAGHRLVLNQSYKISIATMLHLTTAAGLAIEADEEHPNGYALWLLKHLHG